MLICNFNMHKLLLIDAARRFFLTKSEEVSLKEKGNMASRFNEHGAVIEFLG